MAVMTNEILSCLSVINANDNVPEWTSSNYPRICVWESPSAEGDCPIIDATLITQNSEDGAWEYEDDTTIINYIYTENAREIQVYNCDLFVQGKAYDVSLFDSGIPIRN